MDINANEHSIENVLVGGYRMKVPEYQRQYSWTEEQWNALWEDLISIEDGGTHFLGSVVMIEQNTDPVETDVFEIVDGQQRLATLSIILGVMRWRYSSEEKQGIASDIEDFLWVSDRDSNEYQNIRLGRFDNDEFRTVLNGEVPETEESQLKKAADFFSGKIFSLSLDRLDEVRKKLLGAMSVVLIDCQSEESAFQLFETLNDRGLELSAIDLMKNHLFRTASERDNLRYQEVRSGWEEIISTIQYELNQPRRFFLHYILSAPTPDVQAGITSNTLFDQFKGLIDEEIPESGISVEDYVDDMVEASEVYVDIVNAEIDMFSDDGNEKINRILTEIDSVGYTQERTLLLRAFRELDSPTKIVRILRLFETFIVRRRLTDAITGSSVNELHAKLCSEAFTRHDSVTYLRNRLSDESPDDELLKAAIANQNFTVSDRTLYFLKRFEEVYFRNNSSREIIEAEVEHIAPRQSYTAKKYSTWPEYLDTDEEEFETVKDKIGNLTLLSSRMNARAQNDPFEQKKSEYSGSEFAMSNEIADEEEWSIDKIEQRTDELAEASPRIWHFSH